MFSASFFSSPLLIILGVFPIDDEHRIFEGTIHHKCIELYLLQLYFCLNTVIFVLLCVLFHIAYYRIIER